MSHSVSSNDKFKPVTAVCPSCGQMLSRDLESCTCGWRFVPNIVDINDYLKHRTNPKYINECTHTVHTNATNLLKAVNSLLRELGVTTATINSGWRPLEYNKKIGGSGRSKHIDGLAIDLGDGVNGKLALLMYKNLDKLRLRGMAMENPNWTPGWVHLQLGLPGSKRTVYVPNSSPPKRGLV